MLAMTEQPPEQQQAAAMVQQDQAACSSIGAHIGGSTPLTTPPTGQHNPSTGLNAAIGGGSELYAAQKGGKDKGPKGGKGYGQCWECGEWGHSRRECPKILARINNKGGGDVAALKGGKKGKAGKGKGWKGLQGKVQWERQRQLPI